MARRPTPFEKPAAVDLIDEVERTGILPPLHAGGFSAYVHRPADLRAKLTEAGLEVTNLATVEGPGMILADLDAGWRTRPTARPSSTRPESSRACPS